MATDNSDLESKLLVRTTALELAGRPARVLDCFAGEGHMHEQVWHRADEYLGIEKRFGRPAGSPRGECWRGDNKLLLGRAMKRAPWNVVDLDAYGSPWEMFRRVAKTTAEKRLVVALTCGLCRNLCSGKPTGWVSHLAGTRSLSYSGLLVRWYDDIARWTIAHCLRDTGFRVKLAQRARSRSTTTIPILWYWVMQLER